MHPWIGRLIVNFVLCLICFIAYSSQIFIIWPWYGRELSIELITLLLPFNLLVAMLLWNYFLCIVTDPGHVPEHWKPDTHSEGYEVKKLTGAPRYCRVCEKYKPPRAHHCRSCNRCVLRMDHHCPWINNCVGHFNYGHFLRFLFYVDLACSYHLAMVTSRVFDTMGKRYWDEPSSIELVFTILNYVACVPVLMAVGAFSLYHFYCLLGNTTTIEGWEKDKVATMVRRGKLREVKFPYHLGKRKNIESVFGKNPLLWCWPTVTPGTGLKYEIADGEEHQPVWPPRDPTHSSAGPETEFILPSSPWTYENGSVNPDLKPYNSNLRNAASSSKRRRQQHTTGSSALPPYHPDYQAGRDTIVYSSDTDSSGEDDATNPFIRRGSEGYEVRPVDREDLLSQYLREIGEEPGRYHRYIPYPDSESDDDDITLAQTINKK
ncbi:Palmitoyltransferase PFA4 [Hypsizygus marmoreus]|uniref:Palmitoyltransferase PFA4 n=1 Tax=Hypsizygus marmoreus TaxID=39966 RepID=A0A369K3H2_HYPMA|nr:Palmitoyltransferase PFA4 [Hypsizygus marmoreus]